MEDKYKEIYRSDVSAWYVEPDTYRCKKDLLNTLIELFDRAAPQVQKDFGYNFNIKPMRVRIETKDGVGGFAAGGEFGLLSGAISKNAMLKQDYSAFDWSRGVLIGEFVNAMTGQVTGGWPTDWWVNHVWYFPGFVVNEVLGEIGESKLAETWEKNESYSQKPISALFKKYKDRLGWKPYQRMFESMVEDGINLDRIGSNPSSLRSHYVAYYLSLGVDHNLADELNEAGVGKKPKNAMSSEKLYSFKEYTIDTSTLAGIHSVRKLLKNSQNVGKDKLRQANTYYLEGDYLGANELLS